MLKMVASQKSKMINTRVFCYVPSEYNSNFLPSNATLSILLYNDRT